jgi:hypothetical protein
MKLSDLFFKKEVEVEIKKNTAQDKMYLLVDAITHTFEVNGVKEWAWYQDHDDSYIYFQIWCPVKERYCSWAIGYTYNEGVVTLSEEVEEVVQFTEWKRIQSSPSDIEKSQVSEKTLFSWLDKYFNKSKDKVELLKEYNDEEMVSIEPVWRPANEVDLHGDTIDIIEVRKMVDNINEKIEKGILKAGLFHTHETEVFKWQRAWVQEADAQLGETFVKAGTPLISAKWSNKKAWEDKKSGKLMAPSFGGNGYSQEIN